MLIFSSSICIRSSLVELLIVACCCLIFISRVIDHHPAHTPLPSLFTPFILYLTFKPPSQILRARGFRFLGSLQTHHGRHFVYQQNIGEPRTCLTSWSDASNGSAGTRTSAAPLPSHEPCHASYVR
ncbi:hypothetical protein CEP54_008335 [Fusarium duplospermum]|uniref:Uncharacterized protein n=1 Tax=Fusarium duplospermum TaxID=1325734 RepID=A0A428PWI2_9HYPO|nr:hypothetical protein CEP54_008335 [Fusarium duplospermum]